jgi:hypothetical protein
MPTYAASPSSGARMPMPLLAFSVSLNSKRRLKSAYSFSVKRLPPSCFVVNRTPFSTRYPWPVLFGLPLRVPYTQPSRSFPLNSRVNPSSSSWASGAPGNPRRARHPPRTSQCRAHAHHVSPLSDVRRSIRAIIAAVCPFGFLRADITLGQTRLVLSKVAITHQKLASVAVVAFLLRAHGYAGRKPSRSLRREEAP